MAVVAGAIALGSQRQYILAGINGVGLVSPLPISTAYSNGKGWRRGRKKDRDKGKAFWKNIYWLSEITLESLFSTPMSHFPRFPLSLLIIALAVECPLVEDLTQMQSCVFFLYLTASSRATPHSKRALSINENPADMCGFTPPVEKWFAMCSLKIHYSTEAEFTLG